MGSYSRTNSHVQAWVCKLWYSRTNSHVQAWVFKLWYSHTNSHVQAWVFKLWVVTAAPITMYEHVHVYWYRALSQSWASQLKHVHVYWHRALSRSWVSQVKNAGRLSTWLIARIMSESVEECDISIDAESCPSYEWVSWRMRTVCTQGEMTKFCQRRWIPGTPWPNLETGAGPADQIFHLLTGHSGLSAHLKRTGISDTSLCECGQADQTPDHVLQSCPKYAERRQLTWPQGADLATKLWSSAEDLYRVDGFVASTGLKIWPAQLSITEEVQESPGTRRRVVLSRWLLRWCT